MPDLILFLFDRLELGINRLDVHLQNVKEISKQSGLNYVGSTEAQIKSVKRERIVNFRIFRHKCTELFDAIKLLR